MRTTLRRHAAATLIVAAFLALGTLYSLVTPVFEASDEISHYPVVQYIATTGRLPEQRPGVETLWEQEGSQPPLYYLISAGLTAWIDTRDLAAVRWRNPHAKLGIPLDADNKNMVLHTEAEDFPWRGTVLAVHLLRLFGVALGGVTVALTYRLALALWPHERAPAALAAALVAFNPMFLFISASVNNDNLIVLLSTAALLLAVRILQDGLRGGRALLLALAVALATITKISGLALLPLAGLALALVGWRTRQWRRVALAGLGLAAAWLLLAGWWYARNLQLYGELLGLATHLQIAGERSIGLWELRHEWYGFWVSYWALFGAVNILADPEVYVVYAALQWLALAGLVWWVWRRVRAGDAPGLLVPAVLAIQVLIVFAGLVRWTLMTYASQGRLMFPVIGALSALTALGLLHWWPVRFRPVVAGSLALVLLAIAALVPERYIAPAYAFPPVVAAVPPGAIPIGVDFAGLELVAVQTTSATVEAGGYVPITLYWRANRPLAENYSIFLHALGRGLEQLGKIDAYPGRGTLPATRLPQGAIVRDTYAVPLDKPGFAAPSIVRIQIGVGLWRSGVDYQPIAPAAADGAPAGAVIVEAGVVYPRDPAQCATAPPAGRPLVARFGDFAELSADIPARAGGWHPGDTLTFSLYWNRRAATPVDWSVLVHLLDDQGRPAAQADGPPLSGDYPTRLWRRPCAVVDIRQVPLPSSLPAGRYQLWVGLYNPNDPDLPRAPAARPEGSPYPNDVVPLATVEVTVP